MHIPAILGLIIVNLFIAGPRDHGYEACIEAFHLSLKQLQVDYLDLYLIHWPGVQKLKVSVLLTKLS